MLHDLLKLAMLTKFSYIKSLAWSQVILYDLKELTFLEIILIDMCY